jgi:uncharacterized linocin/CFP29 family protein
VGTKAIAHRATRQVSRVLAELIDLEVASVWRRHVAVRLMTVFQTPAGTRSAVARISCRSDVNSEIVLVATDAPGRELRPVASVFDTITTLSM